MAPKLAGMARPAPEAEAPQRRYRGASRETRRRDQRERLILAARDVFAAQGYATARIDEIVARAHVSRSSFYEFFESKEDCLLAVFAAGAQRFRDALYEVVALDLEPIDRIRAEIRSVAASCAADPAMARIVLIEVVGATPAAEQLRAQARLAACQVIENQLAGYPEWRRRPARERQLAAMSTMAAIAEPLSHLVAADQLGDWETIVEPVTQYVARALIPSRR
ncbi:MAG: hypothetical protein QOE38_2731 [Thermoleophilaceae bacterium]|nr:hypothetical protein [Thermoleophilaceae bacterium]